MFEIQNVQTAPVLAGGYVEDMAGIKDLDHRRGPSDAQTRARLKRPGSALAFALWHSSGVSFGDAMSVQYAAACGRSTPFDARKCQLEVERLISERLLGRRFESFREASVWVDEALRDEPWGTAVSFGLSQAFLMAAAQSRATSMAEVVRSEYAIDYDAERALILAQTDSHELDVIDRMLMKEADVLPHANFVRPTQLGADGQEFAKYVDGVCERYRAKLPQRAVTLHFDLYGTLGVLFEGDTKKVARFVSELGARVAPLPLQIETPILGRDQAEHFRLMGEVKRRLVELESRVELIVDEWCNDRRDLERAIAADVAHIYHIKMPDLGALHNSIESVLLCRSAGVKSYLGGSSNETDVSARASAHIVAVVGPSQCLAKPGMGVDEGIMVTRNELERVRLLRSGSRRPARAERSAERNHS